MTGLAGIDPELLEALRQLGLDTVAGAFAFSGGSDLVKGGLGGRRRTYLEVTDRRGCVHRLYLKRYGREGWFARLRRWFAYGPNFSAAEVEWRNIRAARAAGLPAMQGVIRGQEGEWTGGGRSYIVVTAVPGDALSRCGEDFLHRRRDEGGAVLAARLAELVAALHVAGYVHRDLYASHIFLDDRGGGVQLHLIDLARMFAPRGRMFRWRVKDLAQIKSSMPGEWAERYWGGFLAAYLARCGGGEVHRYNRAVGRKAARILRQRLRRQARAARVEGSS